MAAPTPTPTPPSTPVPTPTAMPSPEPSPIYIVIDTDPAWTDVAGLLIGAFGALGTIAVAVVAVWLTVRQSRAETRRAERAARAEWAHQYTVWLKAGKVYMAAGIDAAILTNREWVYQGDDIQTRARLLASPGANDYLVEARKAWTHIEGMPVDRKISAADAAVRMLVFWVEGWVDDPSKSPGDIVPWLDLSGRD